MRSGSSGCAARCSMRTKVGVAGTDRNRLRYHAGDLHDPCRVRVRGEPLDRGVQLPEHGSGGARRGGHDLVDQVQRRIDVRRQAGERVLERCPQFGAAAENAQQHQCVERFCEHIVTDFEPVGRLYDQPRRGGRVQPRPAGDLRHRQHGLVRRERLEDPYRPGEHRLPRSRPGHLEQNIS
jgi:hypothetical protein